MRVLISIICSFTLYFLLVTPVSAQDTNLTAVKQAFDAAGLLHDVPLGFDPTVLLGVTYFSPEARPKTLYSGIQMAMKETYPMPIFSVVGNPGLGPLVLAMIDPDASSRPTPNIAEIRHFLQGGYAFDPISGLLNALPSVSGMPPYHYPRPSVGSGLHR
ncbi:unnamed protein product [Cyclocybe aegerita]|uniref:Uncharacterized protein n=1 Tax=Cyclocybe aegerita TaxID=1973307 RepID=A0A8S0WHV3_CYCAE|nr:unnamed protein product [Cyclocybe aegerita]